MSDGLALVFIEIDGHWLRVDRIQSIHPVEGTDVSLPDYGSCYIKFIGDSRSVQYGCTPEHVLQEIGRALSLARDESPAPPPELDDIAGDEPAASGTTQTRGGSSWGRA